MSDNKIKFNKIKTIQLNVRVGEKLKMEIEEISKIEEVSKAEVIRAFIQHGVDYYWGDK